MMINLLGAVLLFAACDPYDYKELVTRETKPEAIIQNAAGNTLVDFGRDAIGWFEFRNMPAGAYEVVLGEMTNAFGQVTNDYEKGTSFYGVGATIRAQRISGQIEGQSFRVPFPIDKLNTRGWDPKAPSVMIPERLGVISCIRFAEIVKAPAPVKSENAVRVAVNYPIDMTKSSFSSSSPDLDRVYDFCKYSILATSFCGVYVDGDRERTPYEADAYINQLDHYAIDDDYSLGRKSHEWLMDHPTWPTEWKQHSIKMAWADWMWSGDTRSIAKYYAALKNDKLVPSPCTLRADGLMVSTGATKSVPRDIIDWPMLERDGYDLQNVNSVVNAFYYRNLLEMADMAEAIGQTSDAVEFRARAKRVKAAYRAVFLDPADGQIRDAEGSSHKAIHSGAIALAMGLIDDAAEMRRIAAYMDTRGMACSVYFSQYVLDAYCVAGRADLALKYMTAKDNRSWIGMMNFGSTISMEAWSVEAKSNLDLNHAWGATPLNVISRGILGVTPLEAGFKRVLIRPQVGNLTSLKATVPTAKGPVELTIADEALTVITPAPAEITWAGETHAVDAGTYTFGAEVAPYEVRWNGQAAEVSSVRVSSYPHNVVWPGYQRPKHQSHRAFVTTVDRPSGAKAELHLRFPTAAAAQTAKACLRWRPLSLALAPVQDGCDLVLTFAAAGQSVLEFPGLLPELHVFVNDPVMPIVDGPNVLRFEKGEHDIGLYRVKSNQTIVLDEGAHVYGALFLSGVENVKISGRGILDGSRLPRYVHDGKVMDNLKALRSGAGDPTRDVTLFYAASVTNVTVEGVIFKDSPFWTLIVLDGSKNVVFDNVKVVGQWRYNSDGIDIVGSSDVMLKNSFIRAFDDCVVPRGPMPWDHRQFVENLFVTNCVLWCDWGIACKVSAESYDNQVMRNIRFTDLKIVGVARTGCAILCRTRPTNVRVEDVTFENIEYTMLGPRYAEKLQSPDNPDELFPRKLADTLCVFTTGCYGSARAEGEPSAHVTMSNIRLSGVRVLGEKPAVIQARLDEQNGFIAYENVTIADVPPETRLPKQLQR